MAEQYGAINISTANAIGAMLNKKMGVQTGFAPKDWPETSNLLVKLPTKTVSGSVASFSDGADTVPLSSCKATIAPNLDGVSSVDVVQTGRNLLNDSIKTKVGGIILFAGASSSSDVNIILPAGTYTMTLKLNVSINVNLYLKDIDTNTYITGFPYYNTASTDPKSKTFTLDHTTRLCAWTYNNSFTSASEVDYCMIEAGSTAHAYEPYTTPTQYTANLGRTIFAGIADVVNGTGTETHQEIDLGSLTWVYASASNRFYANLNLVGIYTNFPTNANEIADITCADYETITFSSLSGDTSLNNKVAGVTTDAPFITIRDTRFSNANDFKNAVTGKKAVIPLATPTDFTFTGKEINSLYGVNNVWNNVGGNTEVTYRRDCDLALQESEA